MSALAIVGLAWAVVGLVAIGAAVWCFITYTHPSVDQGRLQTLETALSDAIERVGKLELAAGWREPVRAKR